MEQKEIVQCVENSIEKLIRVFCETPYFFYTENDIHCFLYQLIYKNMKGKGNWYTIINGEKDTLPVHKEYPTIKSYKKNIKPTRMHFDIVVFHDTKDIFEFKNRNKLNSEPSKPFIAIQIGLDTDLKHLEYDWNSLDEQINCVENKYLLHFDRMNHRNKTINAIKKKINEYKNKLKDRGRACYINVSNPSEPSIIDASDKL